MANPKIRIQLAPSFRASVSLSRCKPTKTPGGGGGVIVTPTNPGGGGVDNTFAITDENGVVLADESAETLTYES